MEFLLVPSTLTTNAINPVIASLQLCLTIMFLAYLLLRLNLEYLSLVYAIMYIGGVVILLLFVIMLLNIREEFVYGSIITALLSMATVQGPFCNIGDDALSGANKYFAGVHFTPRVFANKHISELSVLSSRIFLDFYWVDDPLWDNESPFVYFVNYVKDCYISASKLFSADSLRHIPKNQLNNRLEYIHDGEYIRYLRQIIIQSNVLFLNEKHRKSIIRSVVADHYPYPLKSSRFKPAVKKNCLDILEKLEKDLSKQH